MPKLRRLLNTGAVLAEACDGYEDLRRRYTAVNVSAKPSPFGSALSFAGDGYVQEDRQLVPDYPFSFVLWCKSNGAIVNRTPFSIVKSDVDDVFYQIVADADGNAFAACSNGFGNFIFAPSAHIINDGEWHLIAYVAEGQNVADHHLYVDDNAVVDASVGGVTTYNPAIDRWGIGCNCDDVDREAFWDGEVRNVVVRPRSVSAVEILNIFSHKAF